MNVDGSGEIVLLDKGLTNVTTLTRNAKENYLYWLNGPGIIQRYNTLTNERSTLHDISHLIQHVQQIVVYGGFLYWADSGRGGIGYIDLADASNNGFVTVIKTTIRNNYGLAGIMDLKIFTDAQVDSCSLHPCEEDATCITQGLTYICLHNNSSANITANTTSETPELLNPCLDYPCDNKHGFCVHEGDLPICSCMLGFDLADDRVTCQPQENCTNCNYHHGECVLEDNMFKCICNEGFRPAEGDNAQCEDIDECESSPCDPEYGACVNTVGAYYCPCPQGHISDEDGFTCQVSCTEDPCQNGGNCSDDQCLCPDGFMGVLCQHESEEASNSEEEEELESGSHDDDDDVNESRRVTVPVIVTIVILLIILVLIIVIVVVFYRRKKNKDKPSP